MAISTFVLTCDHCLDEYTDDGGEGYADSLEYRRKSATEQGWYIVFGPERDLGGSGERAYCCVECLGMDL